MLQVFILTGQNLNLSLHSVSFWCYLVSSFSVLVLSSASWSFRVHMYNLVFSQNLKGIFWELFVCIASLSLVFFFENIIFLIPLNSKLCLLEFSETWATLPYVSFWKVHTVSLELFQRLQSCIICCSKSESSYFVCFVQFLILGIISVAEGRFGANGSSLYDVLAECWLCYFLTQYYGQCQCAQLS